ncbi:hypothetical protein ATANTOWER_015900 [Ataeniobius toweri]|uniref:Uncharacterized protein n=1 Tax=Ataeniobius toweri TaxID=208326 RepID=A0ABU7AVP0_9TELE|nr:hypothetical protein [Ataeniobius toweri]
MLRSVALAPSRAQGYGWRSGGWGVSCACTGASAGFFYLGYRCSGSDVGCLCGCGGVVGDGGPECLLLAEDLLLGEFVPSWCGVGGSVVSSMFDGVCPVVPVGGSWSGIMQGPCLAVAARCVVGAERGGGAWSRAVCGACAVWVLLHRLFRR